MIYGIVTTTSHPQLHVWWRSPRNRHPDCYKMGVAYLITVKGMMGHQLTTCDAIRDGFDSLGPLITALAERNDMTEREVLEWTWGIITFSWLEGYPRRVAKEDRPYYRRDDDEIE